MPQRNLKENQVGSMTGDGSLNNPFESNSITGIPDVQFSDTSLPVFADQFQVQATWNMPIFNFGNPSINIIWTWLDENDFPSHSPPVGSNVAVYFTPGSNSSSIAITFPKEGASNNERKGRLRVEVRRRSVVSALDNKTQGPPKLRAFEIEYNTQETLPPEVAIDTPADVTPSILRLSEPAIRGAGTWTQTTYTQRFYWTKDVSGFTEDDVNLSVAGQGTATLNNFRKDGENNRVYLADITLTGSGTYQISVDPNIARGGGSSDPNSPPEQVSTSWAFDVSSAAQAFAIAGVEIICSETIDLDVPHPELDNNAKGSFLGISDLHVANGNVYFTSQIQKRRPHKNEVSTFEESAGALVSVPTSGGACTPLKKYNFFRKASRSLVSHREEVYFFEGSAYIYDGSAQPNYTLFNVGAGLGVIQRIDSDNKIHEVGLNWRSQFPTGAKDDYDGEHGGTMCPMVSYDDDLHLISERFDNFGIDGIQWITYGKKLNRRVSLLQTNGKTGFQVLEELAMLTNSIIGFKNGRLVFESRLPTEAFLDTSITDSATSINYKLPNRVLDASNFAMIGSEIISYADRDATSLTGVVRGLAGTNKESHMEDSKVIFIGRIINAIDLERPVNDMDIDIDGTLLENNILVKYAENQVPRSDYLSFPAVDTESIMLYGEHEQELILPLDYHQHRWAIGIAEERIKRYKTPQKSIALDLKREFEINLGDIVYLTEPVLSNTTALCQVMFVSQDKENEETRVVLVDLG